MSILDSVLALADRVRAPHPVFAHCDGPCGVYDPQVAYVAAQAVQAMTQKLIALQANPGDLSYENTLSRFILIKEQQAGICKTELLILWTDYFKPEHLQKFPDLHTTFWNAAKLCSKTKQTVDIAAADQLLDTCKKVAEMFAESKR